MAVAPLAIRVIFENGDFSYIERIIIDWLLEDIECGDTDPFITNNAAVLSAYDPHAVAMAFYRLCVLGILRRRNCGGIAFEPTEAAYKWNPYKTK